MVVEEKFDVGWCGGGVDDDEKVVVVQLFFELVQCFFWVCNVFECVDIENEVELV